jgi:hypothetical protein
MTLDHVLRTIGHLTCLTSVGVFLTAMNLAAANAMTLRSPPSCTKHGCALSSRAHPGKAILGQARLEGMARAL